MVDATATVRANSVIGLLSEIKDLLSDYHPGLSRVCLDCDQMTAELEFSIEIPESKIDRTGSAVTLEIPDEYRFKYLRRNDQLDYSEPSPIGPRTDSTYEWKIPAPAPGEYTLAITGAITDNLLQTIIETREGEGKTIRTRYVNKIRLRYTPISGVETLVEAYRTETSFDDRYLLSEVQESLDTIDESGEQLSDEWTTPNTGGQSFSVNSAASDDEGEVSELVEEVRTRVNQGFIQEHIQITGDQLTYDNITFHYNELGLPKSFAVTAIANFETDLVNTTEKVIFQKAAFWERIDAIEYTV